MFGSSGSFLDLLLQGDALTADAEVATVLERHSLAMFRSLNHWTRVQSHSIEHLSVRWVVNLTECGAVVIDYNMRHLLSTLVSIDTLGALVRASSELLLVWLLHSCVYYFSNNKCTNIKIKY